MDPICTYTERVLASDLYLIENWDSHPGPPEQRRNEIFHDFIKLGMRKRWSYHAKAEKTSFGHWTPKERDIVLECRDRQTRHIAWSMGMNFERVVVTHAAHLDEDCDLYYVRDGIERGKQEEEYDRVCKYAGDPFDVLPELVWSMTTFDDPDDVEEAQQDSRDQSLWVSGVYWTDDKIVWIDEFGATIREKDCTDPGERTECLKAFEDYNMFESTWWTEATRIGKYATNEWLT